MGHPRSDLSERDDLERRLDQYGELLAASLDGLSEDEAACIVFPDRPSILGVVRHTAFVQGVWFGEAVTGASRASLGIPTQTAASWKTRKSDSIASVRADLVRVTEIARANLAPLDLDDVVTGRGEHSVRSLLVHTLSELAWNTGQTDILRAALLATR
jgi:hypothetical protein